MNRVRRAALVAFVAHLIAGLSMAFVLRYGLETTPDLQQRLSFLINHRAMWTFGWLAWTAAAITILYFYAAFAAVYQPASLFAVFLTVAALAPDFSAHAIEIGVLPRLAMHALNNATTELFLTFHRAAVMLSGFVANGLYSATALLLVWSARHAYPSWVSMIGFGVGVFGIALSIAAFLDSLSGMYWANVFLLPAILLWLLGVASCKGK